MDTKLLFKWSSRGVIVPLHIKRKDRSFLSNLLTSFSIAQAMTVVSASLVNYKIFLNDIIMN
jgi:hypothetical protein